MSKATQPSGSKLPTWQAAGIRDVQWKVTWMWLLAFVVCFALALLFQAFGDAHPPWFTVSLIPMMVLFGGIRYAYRRGVQDAHSHPAESGDDTSP